MRDPHCVDPRLGTDNNVTAKKGKDGSVTIQVGGGNANTPNLPPIVSGWNCTIRLYRPRKEIIDGAWKFPEPIEIGTTQG